MAIKPEEKRRFPRIGLCTPMRLQIRGLPQCDNLICENISIGGLSFIGNKFIAPATPVMLEINVLSRILHPVGRIVWSSALPHSDRNRVGIEFVDFVHTEKSYLSDYINMQMEKT